MHNSEGAVPRPTPRGGDTGAGSALAALGEVNPEWRPWLDLVGAMLEGVDDPVWASSAIELAPARAPRAPLLDGATISIDLRGVDRWVHEFLGLARPYLIREREEYRVFEPDTVDSLALLTAAASYDRGWLGVIAGGSALDEDALFAVAQLALRPLLLSCGRQLRDQVPAGWGEGYCPICGAWPTIAELRGLKKTRHLRCGSCGGDWVLSILHCPYCDEVEHTKLGGLVVDGEEERRRIETCHSCQGYIKTVASLVAVPAPQIMILDLEMVDHEIAALERGFMRPEGTGAVVELQILPDGSEGSRFRVPRGLITGRWRVM